MSYLEDEIRGALRTEAGRLREVRPLRLPPAPAHAELRAVYRASRASRLSAWRGPVAAVAAVVLIAVVLVALRSLWKEPAAPVAPPKPIAGPPLSAGATPRYYVKIGVAPKGGWVIMAGDNQTGRTLATYPLSKNRVLTSAGVGGAGDDRTFVVCAAAAALTPGQALPPGFTPPTWYLIRISPGAASPVRVTKLAVDFRAGREVTDIALSADGTELAVVSEPGGKSTELGVYSVATGQLRHSWSATFRLAGYNKPVTDLSWVGDGTVGFAVTYTPAVRQEVRTLSTSAGGTSLLADSRVVWSQYVPAPPKGSIPYHAPQPCSTPFLTGDGQAVVCATSSYSARDNRQTALFLAYPVATPGRPRVIGSVPQPTDVNKFNFLSVDWVNPSGTEIIGSWNTNVDSVSGGEKVQTVTNNSGFIGHGAVRPFSPVYGLDVTW